MSNSIHLHIKEFIKVNHEKLTLTLETPKIYRDPVLIILDALTKDTQCWQSYDSDVVMSLLFADSGKLWEDVCLNWISGRFDSKMTTFFFRKAD